MKKFFMFTAIAFIVMTSCDRVFGVAIFAETQS